MSARYDEAGRAGARRGGRGGAGAAVGRLAAAAGRGRSVRAGRGAARARCAARSMRGPRRRRRATGSRPSWPSPTARWSPPRRRRWRRWKRWHKPLAALARRLEAMLEDAPDWLDAQARARVEGAISGLTWRRETLGAWIALARAGRRGRPIPISSTGWRSSGSRGANMTSAIHRHWLDPTRPLAKAVLEPAHGVLVTSATLRGSGGLAERRGAHRGAATCRADRAFRGGRARSIMPRSAEVLIVTDIAPRRHRRAGRRLCPADRGGGRRDARAVHRDPAAARGPCPDRRPAGARRAAAARPACRPDRHRDAGRHLPRRSARLAARHRCAARRGRRARANRCGWW